jgi:hypothetical protein
MNKFDCREIFNKVNSRSNYYRIPDIFTLNIRLGLDDKGNKCLRFFGHFEKRKVKSTKNIDVNFYALLGETILSFSLLNELYEDLFYLFCDDIIESSKSIKQEEGFNFIVNRYEKWRVFSSNKREYLSENEIKGLIGELFFLKNQAFTKYNQTFAIQGWTGTEPTKKDFIYQNVWFEIKVSTQNQISINSIDQLSSDSSLEGHLFVYNLEKMSPVSSGLTLNSLKNDVMNIIKFDEDRDLFVVKLIDAGFFGEEYYDNFVYRLVNQASYRVTDDFPRLHKSNIDPAILEVKYVLDIAQLEIFKE